MTPLTNNAFKKLSPEDQQLLKMKILAMYTLQIANGSPVKVAEVITMRELCITKSLLMMFAPPAGKTKSNSNTRQAWLGR